MILELRRHVRQKASRLFKKLEVHVEEEDTQT